MQELTYEELEPKAKEQADKMHANDDDKERGTYLVVNGTIVMHMLTEEKE